MTDQLIDGKVIPYPNGRREIDTRLHRDATDLELEQAARIEELERHIEEFADHAVDIARRAVEEEREACAKVCEKLMTGLTPIGDTARQACAEAIRARGENT